MANKAGTQLIDATRGADGRFETVAEREAQKWAAFEERFVQIGMSIFSVLFFAVWYLWVAKPLHRMCWNAAGAVLHWLGWS